MKAFNSMDARLLAVFQWLVDLVGRPTSWWAENCAYVLLVGGVLREVLRPVPGWFWWGVIGSLVFATLIWGAARAPAVLQWIGRDRFWRFVAVATTIFATLVTLGKGPVDFWLCLLANIGYASFYYFAACRPPKPRPPRRVLAGSRA